MRTRHMIFAATLAACGYLPFIPYASAAPDGRDHVRETFKTRISSLEDTSLERQLTAMTGETETPEMQEAMEFLYAYMPLPDLLNYPPEYFRRNAELSLKAREEMPWGKVVPDREFRHFVLPVRVNNEDLDMSREAFYDELKDRVKGLDMKDAILEVNHWCHEKVTYQPSDARTSSPLSAVSQAIGRCGEESTFAVAALRAVGIPARQVYTPRWAHTDDNHAWVEAWADGQWYFLGACEPEPILNLAWFNSPASRGMLMTTKAFGDYDGPEEKIDKTAVNTTINVTSNYAPTGEARVTVTDTDGNPVEGASVIFSLYNYAEYNPLAVKKSDSEGNASLTTGIGDLIVWATDGRRFGFAKAGPKNTDSVQIMLDKDENYEGTVEFDITPPPVSATLPRPTEREVVENEIRKAHEDSIRKAYTSTFATPERARLLAGQLGVDPDKLTKILVEARGNHNAIASFLALQDKANRERAIEILLAVSEKDRRDIPMGVVADRLATPVADVDSAMYADYVINPRIENEGLTPFTMQFLEEMGEEASTYRQEPGKWVEWTATNIRPDTVWNPGRLRTHPEAVWHSRMADPLSRDIFFVASARAMGIPSRIDQVTGKTQWHDGTEWIDVIFEAEEGTQSAAAPTGKVKLLYEKVGRIDDPVYYSHFTLSKIEEGKARLLDFDEMIPLSEISRTHPRLDAGQYILTTGQRMADGSVLARSTIFTVSRDGEKDVALTLRQSDGGIQVSGNFNSENLYEDKEGKRGNLLSTTGRGYYTLIYGRPNHEPTSHVLNDISACKEDFEKDGRKVMLIYGDSDQLKRASLDRFPGLPSNIVPGADIDGAIYKELVENLHLNDSEYPIVIVADTFNRVVFVSQGYTIGMGEKLIDVLEQVRD